MMESRDVAAEPVGQLVTFAMADAEFSFPIGSVQEIVRLPEVTPVPGAPPAVRGIMNLRGAILPLIDMRRFFDLEAVPDSEDSRVVVIRHREHVTGMIVDRVHEVLPVETAQIEPPPAAIEPERADWLRGIARLDNGQRVVMILAEEKLLPPVPEEQSEFSTPNQSVEEPARESRFADELLLVSFRLADEEFAVDITGVREIVRPAAIVELPQAPDFMLGVMNLRDTLLPVIDLRRRFSVAGCLPPAETTFSDEEIDPSRIIVVDLGGVVIGLRVDAVSEVLSLSEHDVVPPPDAIDNERLSYVRGVGKLDGGQRLLMLVDLARLVSPREKLDIAAAAGPRRLPRQGDETMVQSRDLEDERQLVCFRMLREEYGIDIMQVREIIRLEAITEVPGAPPFVAGIVNLRGNVLPVVDLRLRFGRGRGERSEQNRILVVEIEGRTTGLIVDAVSEVLRVPESQIEPTPQILDHGAAGRYLAGIAKLDGGRRTIILVNTDTVLQAEELAALPGGTGGSASSEALAAAREWEAVDPAAPAAAAACSDGAGAAGLEELVSSAIEAAEAGAGKAAPAEESAESLLQLKKSELLARAAELGLRVDAKKTKKQIVELILGRARDGGGDG